MDLAVLEHANEKDMAELWRDYHKVDEIPFDFHRRRMSVVVADRNGKQQLITKGAIEEMLSVCAWFDARGDIRPLTKEARQEMLTLAQDYNRDGMRVLGLAQKNITAQKEAFSVDDEAEMVFIGYLAFLDPPKESAAAAIRALNEYGVSVKILTGDNDFVTKCVCKQVGLKVDKMLLGADVEDMEDAVLSRAVEDATVFAKLSPQQKARIIGALRQNGHTVGYMGDGINDAPAMKEADVAVSVDNAVDIAKESANIILLEKDLMVLEQGIVEGRKTYANIIKYIKMTASSNFGNMFSVLVASVFLPFLPMLPIQILVLNLIYDISCITIPWDNVDVDYLRVPRKWDASSISRFMAWIGPVSSVFDILTYALLMFVICPAAFNGSAFGDLANWEKARFIALFHAGWFVESLWSQTLVIHMIRSPKVPFVQSRAAWQVSIMTLTGMAVGTLLPYSPLGAVLKMLPMPPAFFAWLVAIITGYMALATLTKKLFVRRYGELL
jgi:Mg2+-importing ATPase